MDTYYEHIKTRIKGMVSTTYLDLLDLDVDFIKLLNYIENKYSIIESNFNYQVVYEEEISNRDFNHYVTLDNKIYVDIRTSKECNLDGKLSDLKDSLVICIVSYCSQQNNNDLINFMEFINDFIIKNKKVNNNVR